MTYCWLERIQPKDVKNPEKLHEGFLYLDLNLMSTIYNYKKKLLSSTFQILSGDKLLGNLLEKAFRQSAEGELNQKKYAFRTSGALNPETEILDLLSGDSLGKIYYTAGMTRATIRLNDREVSWKFDNTWQTRWSLSDPKGNEITYKGSVTRGAINCLENDELLVLSGLFIVSYYWQMTIVVA